MSGRAGKGASTSGSRGIPPGGKRGIDNAKQESIARAARVQSRSGSSGKGDGLSEAAAAAASLKPKQRQAESETELSPIKRQRGQARGGSRVRAVNSDDEDEISVSGAATTSEEQGRDKLRKCAHMQVQKFKMHSSNIIIVKQLRRIHPSEINSNVARFAGSNIVAVHAPGPAPKFEGSN